METKNGLIFPVIQDSGICSGTSSLPDQGAAQPPRQNQSFVSGSIATAAGDLPKVSSALTRRDHWGTVKTRLGVWRMHYAIDPGLYALGEPDDQSPVLVTANYKMSFDYLREALPGRNAWILVLNTQGINVWCAAGKGTFGTAELVYRIETSGLKKIVKHRNLILPQLGAPGVAAHLVKKQSGFHVRFGPVRAADLPAYLDGSMKKTESMSRITFPLKDRMVLIPIELLSTVKPFLLLSLGLLLISGLLGPGGWLNNLIHIGLFAVAAVLFAVIGGTVINPLMLPYLPGRAFSVKGLTIGLVIALAVIYFGGISFQSTAGKLAALSWLLIIPAVSAYLAMNFTGCSTYTSLSGVKKEMRYALPAQIAAGIAGLAVWITSLIMT